MPPQLFHHDGYVGFLARPTFVPPFLYGDCLWCLVGKSPGSGWTHAEIDPSLAPGVQKREFFRTLALHIAREHGVVEPMIDIGKGWDEAP